MYGSISPQFFLLFNLKKKNYAIYLLGHPTQSHPFLYHVSQSRALFLLPAPNIQLI